jgi:pimeloyl-ACP methyl ester carboxylesterase
MIAAMPVPVLLIHGSAADSTTWSIQLASPVLAQRFSLIAYDRPMLNSVEGQAAVAESHLTKHAPQALVVGSSFGAVVALELIRTRPQLGAVLIEPPMAPPKMEPDGLCPAGVEDDAPAAPAAFLAEYDRRALEQGGPAAAEFFLRTVLGDAAFERMPRAYRDRATAKHDEIRADSAALIAYKPRYAELRAVETPVLLLGGERSAPYFRPTLEALRAHLPHARLEILAGAGHMLHAEASRRFAELLTTFADQIG